MPGDGDWVPDTYDVYSDSTTNVELSFPFFTNLSSAVPLTITADCSLEIVSNGLFASQNTSL